MKRSGLVCRTRLLNYNSSIVYNVATTLSNALCSSRNRDNRKMWCVLFLFLICNFDSYSSVIVDINISIFAPLWDRKSR